MLAKLSLGKNYSPEKKEAFKHNFEVMMKDLDKMENENAALNAQKAIRNMEEKVIAVIHNSNKV